MPSDISKLIVLVCFGVLVDLKIVLDVLVSPSGISIVFMCCDVLVSPSGLTIVISRDVLTSPSGTTTVFVCSDGLVSPSGRMIVMVCEAVPVEGADELVAMLLGT